MQIIYTSSLIGRPVSAVVDRTASLILLYTIAKTALDQVGVHPIFYGLFYNGKVLPGNDAPAANFLADTDEPVYLDIVVPSVVRKILTLPLKEQLEILRRQSTGKECSKGQAVVHRHKASARSPRCTA